MAMKIFNGVYKMARHVKKGEEFKALYPDDAVFKNAFKYYKMPSRQSSKKIRFLLAEIEHSLGASIEYSKTVLEHVCPYHHNEEWVHSFGDGINDIQDRLGNMVLLERDDLKRSSFEDKKAFYKESNVRLARKVAEYSEWNLKSVNEHQSWLATQAVIAWKVD